MGGLRRAYGAPKDVYKICESFVGGYYVRGIQEEAPKIIHRVSAVPLQNNGCRSTKRMAEWIASMFEEADLVRKRENLGNGADPVRFPRASGILLHPTSVPGPFGIGDLGKETYRFIDFLLAAGQRIWQVLPLGLIGEGDSPYKSISAFGLSPLLISPEKLVERGYLTPSDLADKPNFPEMEVDFESVVPYKLGLLRKAFARFEQTEEYVEFEEHNRPWLDPLARFVALKVSNGGVAWTRWDPTRQPDEVEIKLQKFLQFELSRQWGELRQYCHARGIRIIGDIPFYVEHDSADVWANPEMFDLDEEGNPRVISGVPPDYFSATGQLWGNPTYRWDRLEQSAYRWWIDRLRATFGAVDIVRLDHFRGFEAYWEVPAKAPNAINGRWVQGPGAKLFETAQKELGPLPIVAEDLGLITPEVEDIRNKFSFPGMKVLQFAFASGPGPRTFLPHNYCRNVVAYTGTHDNDTTVGWWASAGGDGTGGQKDPQGEQARVRAYLGTDGTEINWAFIRAVMVSVADTVIVPAQDLLGLGSEARMNRPGTPTGNWRWRYLPGALTSKLADRLRALTELCDRQGCG
jgi:4-alpha-glucanotransferase